MQQYHDLCKHILENGVVKGDRTGTGTISTFGYQMRFDLSKGFPLITTKDMLTPYKEGANTNFDNIVYELKWFIDGDTNIKYLVDNGCNIWIPDAYREYRNKGGNLSQKEFGEAIRNNEAFAKEFGNLGPVYGEQIRRQEFIHKVKIIDSPHQEPKLPNGFEPTVRGVATLGEVLDIRNNDDYDMFYDTWKSMINRCYHEENDNYRYYGGKGVFVDSEWLIFRNFYDDVKKLPNWELKVEYPNEYSLDKDLSGYNFYSKNTTKWLHKNDQSANRGFRPFIALSPTGESQLALNIYPFAEKYGLSGGNIGQCLRGKREQHKGWRFEYADVPIGYKYVKETIDQLKRAIAMIKHNPISRRIIIQTWNNKHIDMMTLPPCHSFVQFYVANGKLSCQLYQRSGDVFLGVPYNIASYALLVRMIAQQTGLEVGDFIHTIGDAHIYLNHVEQVKEQITREPKSLAKLVIKRVPNSIFDYKREDFDIVDYEAHGVLKGKVSF